VRPRGQHFERAGDRPFVHSFPETGLELFERLQGEVGEPLDRRGLLDGLAGAEPLGEKRRDRWRAGGA
jgi:hypothetical protein